MGDRAAHDATPYTPRTRTEIEQTVLATEFSERFVDGMRDRMVISFYKYGYVAQAAPERVKVLEDLKRRVAKYEETGNVEWLMDAANFAMIEYMHPSKPDAHYRATDSGESPGRVSQAYGHVTHSTNLNMIPVDTP